MRQLCAEGSKLMLHAMPPPHPEELSAAAVPYDFTASMSDCSALLKQTGWIPDPAVSYADALAELQSDVTVECSQAQALSDALSAATCSCDSLSHSSSPYFIPACC
jgi:hypothetical protein